MNSSTSHVVPINPEESVWSSSSTNIQSQIFDEEKKPPVPPLPDQLDQPESNNTKGCLCVLGAFMGLFSTFGQINAFGTFQAWYTENQLSHRSSSAVSWIGSSQLCAFFLSAWLIGRLFDGYGPRVLVTVGAGLSGLSLMMASISKSYPEFVVTHGVLFGLGSALVFHPCISSVATHYSKYRSTAMGLAFAGNSIGGIVYPIITHKLLTTVGFEKTLRVLGSVCFATCFIAVVTVSSNRDHSVQKRPWVNIESILNINFVITTVGCMIFSFGIFTPYIFIVEYASLSHLTSVSLYILSVMNASGTVGRIVPAILSDIYGRFNLLITCSLLAGIGCLAFWLPATYITAAPVPDTPTGTALVVTFGVVYGMFSGAVVSLVGPCVVQISKRGEEGTQMGIMNSFLSVPVLLGGPIGGRLLEAGHSHGFTYIAAFCGACLILGSLLIVIVRFKLSGGRFVGRV